jgi:hypothetical protein
MKPSSLLLVVLLLSTLGIAQTYSATSAGEVRLGIEAYKNSNYEQAMQHFEKAIDLDSSNLNARMYLATALVSQYIPGVDSKDNSSYAQKAIEQYQFVLNADADRSQRINSAKGIAYLDLNMKKFDDAKTYYQMASDLDPNDPESYYSIGVIDWTKCYQPRQELRAKLGVRSEANLDPNKPGQKKACAELMDKNWQTVLDGIDALDKALKLRPEYDDAMAYMNLMYREKADVECDDLAARAEDLKTADTWVDKTLAMKKALGERAQRQTEEQNKPPDIQ